ncbi:tRNA methyltransferase 10 homolog C [Centroberyx affinis]|uniref:tRNA methyltransferase 10 homolog C n=1 Tax=Centroberyx affinis TaxID=166261 RepID=UPI003A5BCE03
MLRFFSTPVVYDLWKCGLIATSTATKRQTVTRLLPFSSAFSSHHPAAITRHLSTGCSVRKDAPQPKTEQPGEKEKIDFDIWKSVMRSQAAADEKQQGDDEEEAKGEDAGEPGGDVKDGSTLEATRELVVMWQQAGRLVPQEMTDEEVQTLAQLTTKSSKKKYLKYLSIREGHKKRRKEKQQQRKVERAAWLEQRASPDFEAEGGDDQSGQELKNTFLLQFWGRSLDRLLGWKSVQAMMFGQPLVFDMSYEQNMSRREVDNTVSQLLEAEGFNRRATDPFHLHFCNLQPDGAYRQELLKRYGAEAWDRLLVTATDRRHVDVFPRERLVYLTADSPNVLRTFDHSKVYIIGALVDRSIQSGLSLANAKRLKLATARLPLDEFLHWDLGAKNLTLDQMIRIMVTFKDTGEWQKALKFVPTRKHDGFHQQQPEKQVTNYSIRDKRVTHHGQREDSGRSMRSGERNSGGTFRSGGPSFSNSYKDSEFTGVIREKSKDRMAVGRMAGPTGDRENKVAVTRLQTLFKSKMEGKTSTGKRKKVWWEDE